MQYRKEKRELHILNLKIESNLEITLFLFEDYSKRHTYNAKAHKIVIDNIPIRF